MNTPTVTATVDHSEYDDAVSKTALNVERSALPKIPSPYEQGHRRRLFVGLIAAAGSLALTLAAYLRK